MRSAKVDALTAAGLDIGGLGLETVSGVFDEGAKEVLDNVLARRILENVPPERDHAHGESLGEEPDVG